MWCHMFYFTVTCYTENNAVNVDYMSLNSSLPEQNGRRFTDDIFLNALSWIKCVVFLFEFHQSS